MRVSRSRCPASETQAHSTRTESPHSSCLRGYLLKSSRHTAYHTLYQVRSTRSGSAPGITENSIIPFSGGASLRVVTPIVLGAPEQRAAYHHFRILGGRFTPPEMSCVRM